MLATPSPYFLSFLQVPWENRDVHSAGETETSSDSRCVAHFIKESMTTWHEVEEFEERDSQLRQLVGKSVEHFLH